MSQPCFPCGRLQATSTSRRAFLQRSAAGFGSLALASLLRREAVASANQATRLQHTPKAKRVIFLYMDGGPSQVDTFDPKPRLTAEHGQPFGMKAEPTQFDNNGTTFGSPWKFRRYGTCGTPVSDLFPHVAAHVDDMAVIRSMTSQFSEHTSANYFLHTGTGMQGRPSMGAWFGYGLGNDCDNLPTFVVLNGGLIPPGGLDNFNSGFLPASSQASLFRPGDAPLANVSPLEATPELQGDKLALMKTLDTMLINDGGAHDAIESAIHNYELAFQMQVAVPDLYDLSQETAATQRMYGMEAEYEHTRIYGEQCLIARRLVERGVRFVELTCPDVGADRWDQHQKLKEGHANNARAVDQPIAALLTDLKQRGLLDDTLVVWTGEFGRTPFAQGSNGRDHNPFGFSLWMAGGGVRGGTITGATDEYGYKAIENKRPLHDLHATMLHLMGVDHEQLTYRFSGRDMRLTDVHGHLIEEVIA